MRLEVSPFHVLLWVSIAVSSRIQVHVRANFCLTNMPAENRATYKIDLDFEKAENYCSIRKLRFCLPMCEIDVLRRLVFVFCFPLRAVGSGSLKTFPDPKFGVSVIIPLRSHL